MRCCAARNGGFSSWRPRRWSGCFSKRTRNGCWPTMPPGGWSVWHFRHPRSRSTRVSSLKERIDRLESDLTADPPRITAYRDLPFAILRYDPAEEWELRRQVGLLITRLGAAGKE